MSGGTFGGEDINALVFDIGTHSIRVGYAGDFEPKADVEESISLFWSPLRKESWQ